MGILDDAIDRAAQAAVHRPLPQGAPARMRHLVERLGSAAAAARVLGTSPTTVRRYLRGRSRRPRPGLAAALETELKRVWKPGLQKAAIRRARRHGFTAETYARFGYDAPGGSTDEARMRLITQYIPPQDARTILDAHQQGESEERQRELLEQALAFNYFRDSGRRAHGLDVRLTDVEYIDVDL